MAEGNEDEPNFDDISLNDIVEDMNNNDVVFEMPEPVPAASNDDTGEAENLMLLMNVEPPSSTADDVMPKENDFVIVKYNYHQGNAEHHRYYIGQVKGFDESGQFNIHYMRKYLNRQNEFTFVDKMNNGSNESDADLVFRENIVKVVDPLRITRGRHIFEPEICAQYF
jgi:hypothetical protein